MREDMGGKRMAQSLTFEEQGQIKRVEELNVPCLIYRPDTDEYIQWDGDIIIFNNGKNVLDFIDMFPMMFTDCEDFGIKLFNEDDDIDGFIGYNDIEGQLEEERNALLRSIVYGRKD